MSVQKDVRPLAAAKGVVAHPFKEHNDQVRRSKTIEDEPECWRTAGDKALAFIKGVANVALPLSTVASWAYEKTQDNGRATILAWPAATTTVGAGIAAWLLAAKLTPKVAGEQVFDILHQVPLFAVVLIAWALMILARILGAYIGCKSIVNAQNEQGGYTQKINPWAFLKLGLFGSSASALRSSRNEDGSLMGSSANHEEEVQSPQEAFQDNDDNDYFPPPSFLGRYASDGD